MKKVTFDQLEIGKKYKITCPWIPNYSFEGTLTKIVDLENRVYVNDLYSHTESYKQFVIDNGKNLIYNTPYRHGKHVGKFNELFEL